MKLAPLNALRAFECAARHLSFTKAARELHVTPAAVSQQVGLLEEYLGVRLFVRVNRTLRLTEVAAQCLPELQQGFELIASAVSHVRASEETGPIELCAAPSFASKWLVPRLHTFAERQPHIDVRMTAQFELPDFRQGEFHAAIHFGHGPYRGLHAERVYKVAALPLCSPKLLASGRPLRSPSDLRHHRLIHDESLQLDESRPDWAAWLDAASVTDVDASRGSSFSHTLLALEAAIDGHGVVLTLDRLAAADVRAGRLIAPFDVALPLEAAYYFVCPPAYAERAKIKSFRQWLIAEASAEKGPAALRAGLEPGFAAAE